MKVWINQVTTYAITRGFFNSIFVAGSDIYVTGARYDGTDFVATVWKNGIASSLPSGTERAFGNSIYVSGNDVYVAGYSRNITTLKSTAKLWKNGVAINLTDGVNNGNATGVMVLGSDVYVSGDDELLLPNTNLRTAVITIWKNGELMRISDVNGSATSTSFFVK